MNTELVDQYLESLRNKQRLSDQHLTLDGNQLYGEIYPYSYVKILKELSLSEEDVFLDIGSGVGQVVFHTLLATPVKKMIGVEINAVRNDQAKRYLKYVKHDLPELFKEREVEFFFGDCLTTSLDSVTAVYTCSTAFSGELLEQLGTKLNFLPKLQTVISLRKLATMSQFYLDKILQVECSWDTSQCYVYRRQPNKG